MSIILQCGLRAHRSCSKVLHNMNMFRHDMSCSPPKPNKPCKPSPPCRCEGYKIFYLNALSTPLGCWHGQYEQTNNLYNRVTTGILLAIISSFNLEVEYMQEYIKNNQSIIDFDYTKDYNTEHVVYSFPSPQLTD